MRNNIISKLLVAFQRMGLPKRRKPKLLQCFIRDFDGRESY